MAATEEVDNVAQHNLENEENQSLNCSLKEEVNIPCLYIQDLDNTLLSDAIRRGMHIREGEVMIHWPRLKEFLGVEILPVNPRNGDIRVNANPPYKFVLSCSPDLVDQ